MAHRTNFRTVQQRNNRQHAGGGTARRSPSDRTLVSEWARKRKRAGIDLSTYA
ncbi:hypothetical protein GPE28_004854 [Salmonella enterica]|nr:hypothetical protein [Salmonella enterica subsp. enterica serovar Schwarzengrund]EDS9229249.1 hypothetical protein [Salmonella enterica subsp. enterica serovar Derby]EDU9977089.1 hypothetical protein [Salmonella enterica subsp. enterica serovar Newport]EDV7550439.1 hypothetical protein [Salmonella enterica subsp. enterica serovar Uganda]EDY1590533.1 hypothetical protein [Salmonella enterica]EEE0984910.1 hypothetical protein [Salmonella enterica subsp. enterica serovar Orion]EEJ0198019.1 hy